MLDAAPALPQTETRQFVRIIDTQADHLLGLIGDLLDAGRIEAGMLSVDAEPSEAAALVDRARNTFLSGGGRRTVAIDLPRGAAAGDSRPRARRSFASTSRSPAATPATGWSLPSARAGGGAWRAHPRRERGARTRRAVRLTLPVAAGADAGAEARPAARRAPGMARGQQHILVVDDDPHALRFVRDALAAAGYAVAVTAERASWSPSSAASGRSSCCSTWCCRGGAADYLVKPCSATELTARVGATWRSPPPSSSCCASSVNAERVVPSESLLRQVWGTRRDTGDTERVRAFVRQLRAKLGDHAARPTWIFNVRGVGYRMPTPGEE